jgi:outer membrane phospholipase A
MCEDTKSSRPGFGALLIAVVLLGGSAVTRAGELAMTLLGPAAPVANHAEVRIWLNVLNVSAAASSWKFPSELNGRLRLNRHEMPVRLQLVGSAKTEAIPAQGFARAEYALQLAGGREDDAVLEVDEIRGSAVTLRIQAALPVTGKSPEAKTTGPSDAQPTPGWKKQEFDPIEYFKRHLFPHEPFYFVAGGDSPNAKFQFSFKYQLVDGRSGLAEHAGFVTNLFFGFTQTSLWDWERESAPFEDSSYKPELMFQFRRLARAGESDWFQLGLQTGLMHESNGRDGINSRSLNIGYLRPKVIFGHEDDWQFTLAPRAWLYIGELDDNPDLERYRGYADLRATIGTPGGIELAALARVGDEFDRGSLQLDLTFPLRQIRWVGFTWYLQAQYFTGYGESLLHYNERSEAFRIGFSLYR